MTPLRQRMIEDLQLRGYSERTVEAYVASRDTNPSFVEALAAMPYMPFLEGGLVGLLQGSDPALTGEVERHDALPVGCDPISTYLGVNIGACQLGKRYLQSRQPIAKPGRQLSDDVEGKRSGLRVLSCLPQEIDAQCAIGEIREALKILRRHPPTDEHVG